MRPEQRENQLYRSGKRCRIQKEEKILFRFLERYVPSHGRILDLGCGSGEIGLEIQRLGYRVTGLDFSEQAIQLSQSKGVDASVHDLDTGLPFADDSFQAVWAGDVIEHLFDPLFVLREVNRVLAPGGYLLATVPYDLNWPTRLRIMAGRSYQEGVYRLYGQYKHHTFFSLPLLSFMLQQANLKREDIRYLIRVPKTHTEFVVGHRAFLGMAKTIIFVASAQDGIGKEA